MKLHVTVETRKVYRSARGTKLTKHAAYIAAAKKLIADRCAAWDEARAKAWEASLPEADEVFDDIERAPAPPSCVKDGPYQCRFHTWPKVEMVYTGHGEYDERSVPRVAYYRRVLDRLVRFLKYVDARRIDAPTTKPCPYCGGPRRCSARARAENPFCAKCLDDRLREASTGLPAPTLVHEGEYVRIAREP